jgi:hypothetical protein
MDHVRRVAFFCAIKQRQSICGVSIEELPNARDLSSSAQVAGARAQANACSRCRCIAVEA